MMTLSTSTCIDNDRLRKQPGYTVENMIDALHAAGFEVLDMNLWDFCKPGGPMSGEDWKDWVYKTREYLDKVGVRVRQAHGDTVSGMEWDAPDGEAVARMRKMNVRCVEAAKIFGADWMVMHPSNFPHDKLYSVKKAQEANLAYIAPYLEQAKKLGIGIAVEHMVDFGNRRRRYCGGNPEELIELVDAFHDPALGACIDTGHANNSGMHAGELIRLVGKRLKCTHINDNKADKDSHLPPFFGTIDWQDVMKALVEIDYQGDFSFELDAQRVPFACRDNWYRFIHGIGEDLFKMR